MANITLYEYIMSFYPFTCFIFFNFIYLFLAVLGLCCWMQAFSSWHRLELPSSMQASHCSGFSCCRAWALGCTGFSSWGSIVVAHRLSCPMAWGIFPDQGWNPCPLQWKHRPLTTRLPGKSSKHLFRSKYYSCWFWPSSHLSCVTCLGLNGWWSLCKCKHYLSDQP